MSIVITLLTVLLVAVCFLMIFVVLMQRPRQEGLGAAFGSSMTDRMFGAQTTSVLQRATVWLAVMFFVLTLGIAMLMARQQGDTRVLEKGLASGESSIRGTESGTEGTPVPGFLETPVVDPSLPAELGITPGLPPVGEIDSEASGVLEALPSGEAGVEETESGETTTVPAEVEDDTGAGEAGEAGEAGSTEPSAAGEEPAGDTPEPAEGAEEGASGENDPAAGDAGDESSDDGEPAGEENSNENP